MFGNRIEIRFSLKTLTATHVGTGEFKDMPRRDGTNEAGQYAAIVRDEAFLPYLPSTSLKGVLRRLAEETFPKDPGFDALFGTIKHSVGAGSGAMGLLLVHAGRCAGTLPDTAAMPYGQSGGKSDGLGKGAFIAARTAIDAASGVADDHKLFFQEMLPPGVSFNASMTVLEFGPGHAKAVALLKNLLRLAMRDGLSIGKSQADGQGHLQVAAVSMRTMELNADGELKQVSEDRLSAAASGEFVRSAAIAPVRVRLRCAMPFAVIDSSVKGEGREKAMEQGTVQLSAQKLRAGMPLINGSSIAGVLRSRADWLGRIMQLRGEMQAGSDPVRELFGDTGWKGILDIRHLMVSEAREEKITSLKIDRFTGAPVFGALFTTAAFTGTRLSFELRLHPRAGKPVNGDAEKLFHRLAADINANGLQLGHGTNKGFGWFEPEEG
ncbi:CRISPR/Cas system CSM-associated protein Csm3 (group 7 of RAMP superfamily) [Hoeflea marina]|uniref:CRISPR/Cas system CSM-associated protein Csm3 (Group 7 of RAMP superfamily) n=1 Tax=Hoeflea marina TaxID=274592 RepID=A0A317PRL9_9HYPH|nr:RAMP superfamily CRISPR-associated protein [Hoeflea marina]PWW03809.1 CRISPR/Cas system CSM-associated protein Csm3 (group 7 of RAMP superfamily) [Hoeflea marina]